MATAQIGVVNPMKNHNEWKLWQQKFNLFLIANNLNKISDNRKCALLLQFIGDKYIEVYNSFNMDEEKMSYEELLEKFTSFFEPKKKITLERQIFFNRKQHESEKVEEFLTHIINFANKCDFGEMKLQLVRDIFIAGLNRHHQKVREALLLKDEEYDTDKMLQIARSIMTAKKEIEVHEAASSRGDQVLYINKNNYKKVSHNQNQNNRYSRQTNQNYKSNKGPPHDQNKNSCTRCGQINHKYCPAKNKACAYCKKIGHFAKYCYKNQKKVFSCQMQDELERNDHEDEERKGDILFVGRLDATDDNNA